tara:strand:- start:721 stop:1122 length:402 start_codon:yes stop_codon:yes gene_type:complete
MNIVLDTNVFVSGIFWSGAPAKVVNAWLSGDISLVMTADILNEYVRIAEKLGSKYQINFEPFINFLTIYSDFYDPISLSEQVSRDFDDDKFIAAAIASGCKIIVSGDGDLLYISGYAGISVLKPSTFVKKFLT